MSDRMRRVNSLLAEAIAEEVEELKDPRLGFVTVTGVETAPNLRTAIVWYGVIGSPEEVEGTQAALDAAAPRISSHIGRQVRLKYTPTLEFRKDESTERSARITQLLRDVADRDEGEPDEPTTPPADTE
jgi:ribosome-binding factor A